MTADDEHCGELGLHRLLNHPLLGALPVRPQATFTVDGRELRGLAGEPLAASLLAHGVTRTRTMPTDGASRGVFCGVGRCSDCLMTIDGEPNVRVCVTPLRDGMRVETQHGLGTWGAGN